MEEIILKIKDKSKLKFLKQLLEQLDFVELKKQKTKNILIIVSLIQQAFGKEEILTLNN